MKIVQTRSTVGAELVAQANIPGLQTAVDAIKHCHERWDGSGYPDRLAGTTIPIAARCVAIAETFDVLTQGRPYRPAWPQDDALREIVRCAGSQFDPELVSRFIALVSQLNSEHSDLAGFLAADAAHGPYAQARSLLTRADQAPSGYGTDLDAGSTQPLHADDERAPKTVSAAEESARRRFEVLNEQLARPEAHSERIIQQHVHALLAYPEEVRGPTWVNCMLTAMHHAYLQARSDRAAPLVPQTLRVVRKTGSLPLLRKALTFSGAIFSETFNPAEALKCFVESIDIARKIGDLGAEAPNWNNAGLVFAQLGAYADATLCHKRAAELSIQSAEFADVHVSCLINIAACANRTAEFADGMRAAKRGLELVRIKAGGNDKNELALLHACLVDSLLAAGQLMEAEQHAAHATSCAGQNAHPRAMLFARLARARVQVHRGLREQALAELTSVIDAARRSMPGELLDALEGCAALFDSTGHADAADRFVAEAAALRANIHTARALDLHVAHVTQLQSTQPATTIEPLRPGARAFNDPGMAIQVLEEYAICAEMAEDATATHIFRVGRLASMLAAELGLDGKTCDLIELAGRLHDIGKLAVPTIILAARGRLSSFRRRIAESHANAGADLIRRALPAEMNLIEDAVRHRHERWDGTGYPSGIRGEDIPLAARIVAVADAFDVLTHVRPRKRAWPVDAALAEIERNAGMKFDPTIVGAFVPMLRRVHGDTPDLDAVLAAASSQSMLAIARHKLLSEVGSAVPAFSVVPDRRPMVHRPPAFVATPRTERLLLLQQIAHDMKHPALVHDGALINARDILASAQNQLANTIAMLRGQAAQASNESHSPTAPEYFQRVADLLANLPSALDIAEFSTRELRTAMEDVVDVLRFDAGGMPPNLSTFDLSSLFAEIDKQHTAWAAALGIALEISPVAISVLTDRRQLQRLITNLIVNALSHSQAKHIRLSASLIDSGVVVEVDDDGRGIDPQLLPHVFSLHKRGAARQDTRVDSRLSGIGLYLAGLFAKRLDGDLSVHSEVGRGTRFSLRLNCFAQAATTPKPEVTVALSPNLLAGRVVAVLDDHKLARRAIATAFESLGAQVVAESDVLDFVDAISGLPRMPDLLLIDYFVGTHTARDIQEWLESFHRAGVPIFVATARADSDELKSLPSWMPVLEKDAHGRPDILAVAKVLTPRTEGIATQPDSNRFN